MSQGQHISGQVSVENALLSGTLSGMFAKSLVAPLDRVRIMYLSSGKAFTFKSGFITAKNICKDSGCKGLWRGNSSSMLRVAPYCTIQYIVHEQLKSWFDVRTYEKKVAKPGLVFLAGCLSGFSAIITTYPLDVMRARLATDDSYKSNWDVIKRSIFSMDIKYSLYRGLAPTLLAKVPLTGTSFFVYELGKMRYFMQAEVTANSERMSLLVENLILSSSVAVVCQTAVYPLDVVRRRMQTNVTEELKMKEWLVHIVKEEGIRGLYKGITLSWIKLPVVMGSSLVTFDFFYDMLKKYRQ